MKRILSIIAMVSLLFLRTYAQEAIEIDIPESIIAGQAWELSITDMPVGEPVEVIVLSGLQQYQQIIEIDESDIVSLQFNDDTFKQAGTALLFVTTEQETYTRTLQVLPDEPSQIDLFATGNAIAAYGEGETQLISFVYDAYSNPIDSQALTFNMQSPDGQSTQSHLVTTKYGRANLLINSLRNPGLLEVAVEVNQLSQALQILQFPTEADDVDLTITPECLLLGRSESIQLEATVVDRQNFTVRDGTQVIFQWDDGFAFGTTINGMASLSLPPFGTVGEITFTAQASSVSDDATLQIAKERCS